MAKRFTLPLSLDESTKPTVEVVRKRLGGRASTDAGAGEFVTLLVEGGHERTGVVLFVRGLDLDVWVEHGVVRRVRRHEARSCQAPANKDLCELANDARVFAHLSEGQRVRYQNEGGFGEGALVEKCRFGALVERDDRVVVGVGFRRIWPVSPAGAKDN